MGWCVNEHKVRNERRVTGDEEVKSKTSLTSFSFVLTR